MVQTLESLHRQLREQLGTVIGNPLQLQAETRLILEEVAGVTYEQIVSDGTMTVPENVERQIAHLLYNRLEKRIPMQYLLHAAWFYSLKLYVNPYVLIPRPETELLVEEALKVFQPGQVLLDVGTGSGAIALALAHRLGDQVQIHATELSAEALSVARLNQRMLQTTIQFHQGDLLSPVQGQHFDILVSNPPYIAPESRESLAPEVRDHEPLQALFTPPNDPLHYYRRLAIEAPAILQPGGWLLLEMGEAQQDGIIPLFENAGYQATEILPDFAGLPRLLKTRFPD